MKEYKTLTFGDFKSGYPDHWHDAVADIDWNLILHAFGRGDTAVAGKLLYWMLEKPRQALEGEINHGTEPSQSEIDEDNRLMDNRDRIGGMK